MNFYVGQDVVCIKTHSQKVIKEGDVFTIKGLKQGCCKIVIDINLKTSSSKRICTYCYNISDTNGICWFGESLFAPLDSLTDISEIEEVLIQPAYQ